VALPPLPAIGSIRVELFSFGAGADQWDVATWDNGEWVTPDWQDVTPQSVNVKVGWGADSVQGVLSVTAAGDWTIRTYDPDRLLDPSNPTSPYSLFLHPGSAIRVMYRGSVPENDRQVRGGIIDSIAYNISSQMGSIRATDGVAALVAAQVPAATTGIPTTLRAMARAIIAKVGLTIPVEADPEDGDPPIGANITDQQSAWQWMLVGAFDSLRAVWINAAGVLSFRPFGAPRDLGLTIGGADGIPIDDLDSESSLAGVVNRVIAYDTTAPTVAIDRTDATGYGRLGNTMLKRDRPVPLASSWVDSVLADRSRADLTYRVGTLRIQTEADLIALIDTGMVDIAHIFVDSVVPPFQADARVLGGTFEANTETGWSAELITYVPGREWEGGAIPPPVVIPPPVNTQTVTRVYAASKDTRAARSNTGSNLGSGTASTIPVGAYQSWRNRALLDFASINWADVKEVVSAELWLTTSDQVNIAFGSSPKVQMRRITQSWSEGSASSPSGSNSTVYPGPSTTTTGATTKAVSKSQNASHKQDVTAIVRAWAPVAAGGSGASKYGIAIYSAAEDSTSATTEFWAREHGSSTDAELRVTVKIPA
jgi:hypothetical protein